MGRFAAKKNGHQFSHGIGWGAPAIPTGAERRIRLSNGGPFSTRSAWERYTAFKSGAGVYHRKVWVTGSPDTPDDRGREAADLLHDVGNEWANHSRNCAGHEIGGNEWGWAGPAFGYFRSIDGPI